MRTNCTKLAFKLTQSFIPTLSQKYIYPHFHTITHTHTYTNTHTHTFTQIHTLTQLHISTHSHKCTYPHIHTNTHPHFHTHPHIHILIHAHFYIKFCTQALNPTSEDVFVYPRFSFIINWFLLGNSWWGFLFYCSFTIYVFVFWYSTLIWIDSWQAWITHSNHHLSRGNLIDQWDRKFAV